MSIEQVLKNLDALEAKLDAALTAQPPLPVQPEVCKANQQCLIGLPCVCWPEERNFCPRCGKRTADLTAIHTCTPPQEKNT
jgi:hypothetical protein